MMENEREVNMLLAGDIGGTKTLIGLYEPAATRPRQLARREFATLNYPDLASIVRLFLEGAGNGARAHAASFGVAGPVLGRTASLTNVPWRVDADAIGSAFGIARVGLINDLEAMAYGVTVLDANEVAILQEGQANPTGNIAVIAAGTGLGEAFLHRVDNRLLPAASEGGHADYAARNEREFAVARDLIARVGRAEVEHVVSGMGLVNVFRVTHKAPCAAGVNAADPGAAAGVSQAALAGTCAQCAEALQIFVDAYGAEAGNLALRTVATSGVYVGGGIAPKILPALSDGRFMGAFVDKAPFSEMLRKVPVKVVLNPEVGLLGAALHASLTT
jgi:glucokinase